MQDVRPVSEAECWNEAGRVETQQVEEGRWVTTGILNPSSNIFLMVWNAIQIRGWDQGDRILYSDDYPDTDPVRAHTFRILDNLPQAGHAGSDSDIRDSRWSFHLKHEEQDKIVEEEMEQINPEFSKRRA